MKKIKYAAITLIFLASFFINAFAQSTLPVKVTAWGMHHGGRVIYKYRVQNLGANPIDRIFIGFYPPTATADGAAELTVAPYYPSGTTFWLPASVSQSPPGWGVNLSFPEESTTFALDWIEAGFYRRMRPKADSPDIPVAQNPPNIMPPGATWEQFSVTLPQPDYAYVQGHANLSYGDNELTIQMEKGDTTPPVFTVNATPIVIWPPNNKMVDVAVNLMVKDDYDPEPEIQLVSITSNEVLAADDIQGAQYGADDRQFSLRATRAGTNLAGRIYTITYSATDGSGNKSTASTTVTVPHDQR